MKKSDWTMIIFVALVTGFVSFMVTNSIMGDERKPAETVKTTIIFSDRVDEPSRQVFRVDDSGAGGAINPTVPITTGSGQDNKNTHDDSGKPSAPDRQGNSDQPDGTNGSNTSGNQNNSRPDVL